jgi:Flp pilus assembly protein TadD
MLTAKNVHLTLLGIILGSVAAYSFASYRAEVRREAQAEEIAASLSPPGTAGHPDVTDAEMVALFEEALERNPNDPELMSRFGSYLFGLERFAEAARWFRRVLEITPDDANTRTLMGTSLYASGRVDEAIEAFNEALQTDHDQVLALHNLAIADLDRGDVPAAEDGLVRIESIDPTYVGLPSLRGRIEAARNGSTTR